MSSVLDTLDTRLGNRLDHAICAHHRRRLTKLGWAGALTADAPAPEDLPARAGNAVRVLLDGEEALSAMVAAIEGARSHVHIAGWFTSPSFRPVRGADAPTMRELLARVAERVPVRLLVWAGPPLPVFQPTRRMVDQACAEFRRDSKVHCVADRRERTLHCHHEKIVVVDDEIAFVGGIDFTALSGDRHDSTSHRPDRPLGWHDVATQLHGPVVADVATHFAQRWSEVAGETLPAPSTPEPAGDTGVRLVRTVPERTYRFAPHGEFGILREYLRALRSARSLVYLENQFLWSPEVVDTLIELLRDPPTEDLRMVLLLPRRPDSGADTTRGQLGRLLAADGDRHRLLATTISTHAGQTTGPLYVHAKVGIVDDTWMTIGSANLNEHSLFNDTEVNVVLDDHDLITATRHRLWAEHLERTETEVAGDPTDVIDRLWWPTAEQQAELERHDRRRTHRLSLLPSVSRRAERLQGPVRGLLVDG
ncbi:MAG TPA: phospholipase D family protein [Pseudonocardiaceae bacterium]|nr:phospholipase D family protein [Pseudonocardiaceae bacterium]